MEQTRGVSYGLADFERHHLIGRVCQGSRIDEVGAHGSHGVARAAPFGQNCFAPMLDPLRSARTLATHDSANSCSSPLRAEVAALMSVFSGAVLPCLLC